MEPVEVLTAGIGAKASCAKWSRIDRTKTFDTFERLVAVGTWDEGAVNKIEFRTLLTEDARDEAAAGTEPVSEPLAAVSVGGDVTGLFWLSPTSLLAATSLGDVHLLTVTYTPASAALDAVATSALAASSLSSAAAAFVAQDPGFAGASVSASITATYASLHGGEPIAAFDAAPTSGLFATAGEDGTVVICSLDRARGDAGVLARFDHSTEPLPATFATSSGAAGGAGAGASAGAGVGMSDDAAEPARCLSAVFGCGLPARFLRFSTPHTLVSGGAGGATLVWDLKPFLPPAQGGAGGPAPAVFGPVLTLLPPAGSAAPTATAAAVLATRPSLYAVGGDGGRIWLTDARLGRAPQFVLELGAAAGTVTALAFVPWTQGVLAFTTDAGWLGMCRLQWADSAAGPAHTPAAAAAAAPGAEGALTGVDFLGLLIGSDAGAAALGAPGAAAVTYGGLPLTGIDFDAATRHVLVAGDTGRLVHFSLPTSAIPQ